MADTQFALTDLGSLQQAVKYFGFAFSALLPLINPLGCALIFVGLVGNAPPSVYRQLAGRIAISTTLFLLAIELVGTGLLRFFGISLPVLKIAGGLIVANTAWGMVTAGTRLTSAESDEATTKEDISLTPMAMPILSGPGSIGVVMGLAAHVDTLTAYVGMVIGIAALALSVYLFLRLGGPLVARLGPSTVGAISRIFGFLILAIAVQLIWDGVADFNA